MIFSVEATFSMKAEEIRELVREGYAEVAKKGNSCCSAASSCCDQAVSAEAAGEKIGYTAEELGAVPQGANLGLGCGNPLALASLKEGETVLDLGCGAGFDCFLAVNKVGKAGRVIGVDMTPPMLDRARENARQGDYQNVEFRLGEIENLPVADGSVDVVISNCVINLSPDKRRVFAETFRVLKPGGRLMVSDTVLLRELPDVVRESSAAYVGCVAGAIKKDDYLEMVKTAGFQEVEIVDESVYAVQVPSGAAAAETCCKKSDISEEAEEVTDLVSSIRIRGVKPE